MKLPAILIVIAVLALAGCATTDAAKPGMTSIEVPTARLQECEAQGGCQLVSFMELLQMASETYELGAQTGGEAGYMAGQQACKKAPS